jgi:hypothetical protein
MTPQAREGLARELYVVHEQIFGGLSFEDFKEYVVERPAYRTWVWVKHDGAGRLVGYHSTHVFQLTAASRRMTVVRMEAGTLPSARGRDLTMLHNVLRLLLVWLSQPWRRFCIFAALTHPSSYTFLAHYAPVIYPHVDRPIPAKTMGLMEELAEAFELQRVDEGDPMVRSVNWVTLESPEETYRWQNSRRRDTRFYMKHNPGYAAGHGLLTYIPFNGAILLRSLARFLVGRGRRLAKLLLGNHINVSPAQSPPGMPTMPAPLTPMAPSKPRSPRSLPPRNEWAHTRPPSL